MHAAAPDLLAEAKHHHKAGDFLRAEQAYRLALQGDPGNADVLYFLGAVCLSLGKYEEAVAHLNRVSGWRAKEVSTQNLLGMALAKQGKTEEAEACFLGALALDPNNAEAHYNLGLARLYLGDFGGGWPEYDWRWKTPGFQKSHDFPRPRWDGSPLDGRSILVTHEQGLGDTLQFVRYAPLLEKSGARVSVACQPPLKRILARCPGIDRVVAHGDPLPEFDVHAPILSIPRWLGTTPEAVSAGVPYLAADPALVEAWRRELGPDRGLRVGIAWQGNPRHDNDRARSFRLACFEPASRVAGVRLFSLQMGFGSEQVAALRGAFAMTDLGRALHERSADFMDTAALLKNLDLVITADTALAHLAGALGMPVWVALPYVSDWRWMRSREDSPWYPTMRLFRQASPGDWEGVFGRIAAALDKRAHGTGAAAPRGGASSPEASPGGA